jgi:uncharacterized protein
MPDVDRLITEPAWAPCPASVADADATAYDAIESLANESAMTSTTSIDRALTEMVRRIVSKFDPERINLFGSHARGAARRDSDVDLLVVMPVRGSRREAAIQIGTLLHDIRIPKDIIVATPESFAWRQHVVGTIEWPAAHEGRVIYARTG